MSGGIHTKVIAAATTPTGALTKNVVRQPQASINTPPNGSPAAAVTVPVITRPPSTAPGGPSIPSCSARPRTNSIAAG
ncbi:Uncharacterised protein [Mycobacteroides abscessus subsp. abscessus]|nr:Uncharacterised protein [Mycobacteroides abscessus subsp. abscessus]